MTFTFSRLYAAIWISATKYLDVTLSRFWKVNLFSFVFTSSRLYWCMIHTITTQEQGVYARHDAMNDIVAFLDSIGMRYEAKLKPSSDYLAFYERLWRYEWDYVVDMTKMSWVTLSSTSRFIASDRQNEYHLGFLSEVMHARSFFLLVRDLPGIPQCTSAGGCVVSLSGSDWWLLLKATACFFRALPITINHASHIFWGLPLSFSHLRLSPSIKLGR